MKDDPIPSLNGHIPPGSRIPPMKKPRKKKKKEPAQLAQPDGEEHARGRLASEVQRRTVEWLLHPWIPRGMLSFVVGLTNVGKSTFVAWLIARAKRAVIFPGYEEEFGLLALPRLEANGAKLDALRVMDDRQYRLPRDEGRIIRVVSSWDAGLVVFDPVDSYMEDGLKENDGQAVRAFLESVSRIGNETGAAIVGMRHKGKDRHNVMPGSRAWGDVPRCVVELVSDGGSPPRFLMRHWKDKLGTQAKPQQYKLQGEPHQPPKFILQGAMDASLTDLSLVANDPTAKRRVMEACKLIYHLFSVEEKPTVQDLVNECRKLGISEGARDEAKRLLDVMSKPDTAGGQWRMFRFAKEWPGWLLEAVKQLK